MSQRETLSDITVVDVDVHVNETPAELAPYCDMPWRKALEHIETMPRRYLSIAGFAPEYASNLAIWPGGHNSGRTVHTAAQMREDLTALNIDVGVIFPDNLLLIATFPQKEYASALARAYNAWLVDKWCDKEKGLKGLIIAAPQDPPGAVREIEKYKSEPGIVGVYMPCAGLPIMYGDEKYDPVFEAAQEAGLPLLFHSVLTMNSSWPNVGSDQYETVFGRHVISHSLALMANLIRMMEKGIPVRFPGLKMAFVEGGLSWVPFLMMRLDKEYMERRREVPLLEHRPSYYMKKYFYATQPVEEPEDPHDLVKLIELYKGFDNTMFASDWPHHDFDHPRAVFNLPVSPDIKRKLMGGNAMRFFNIDAQGNRLNLK